MYKYKLRPRVIYLVEVEHPAAIPSCFNWKYLLTKITYSDNNYDNSYFKNYMNKKMSDSVYKEIIKRWPELEKYFERESKN